MQKNGKTPHGQEPMKTMTIREVTEYLGVSDTTVNRYVQLGHLKKYKRKFGLVRVYFDKAEVEKFKQEQQLNAG